MDQEEDRLWTELRDGVMSGNTATVERVLLEKSALGERFDLARLDSEGLTLLHQAIFGARLAMLRLLHKHGGDVSVRDEEGCTLLHTAAIIGSRLIAAWLIKEGANVAAVDKDGMLPLDRAEDSAMEELLVQAMARAGHVGLAMPSQRPWQCLPNVDRDSDYGTSSSICSLSEDEERTSHTFDSSADEAGTDRESDVSSLAASPGVESYRCLDGQANSDLKNGDLFSVMTSDSESSVDARGRLVRVHASDISMPLPQNAERQSVSPASESNSPEYGSMTRTTVEILWSKVRRRQPSVEKTFIEGDDTELAEPADQRSALPQRIADHATANARTVEHEKTGHRSETPAGKTTYICSADDVSTDVSTGKVQGETDEAIAISKPKTASQSTSLSSRYVDHESNSSDDTLLAQDHSDLDLSVSETDASCPSAQSDARSLSAEKQSNEFHCSPRTSVTVELVAQPQLQTAQVLVTPPAPVSRAATSEWAESLESTHSFIASRRKELRETGERLKSWSEKHRGWPGTSNSLHRQSNVSDDVFDPCVREQPIARKSSLLSRSLASHQFKRPVGALARSHTLSEVDMGWVSPNTQARPRVSIRRKPLKSLLRRTSTVYGDRSSTPRPRKSVSFPVEVLLADAIHAGDIVEVERFIVSRELRGKVLLDNGLTPLHLAVLDRQRAIVKLLLSNGVKVDQRDADGWTALHAAASEGTVPVTHLLLENGADPWAKTERDGKTAYQLASNDNVRLVLSKAMGETSRQVNYLEPQSSSDSELDSGNDDEEEEVLSDDEDNGTQSDMDGADTDSIDSASIDELEHENAAGLSNREVITEHVDISMVQPTHSSMDTGLPRLKVDTELECANDGCPSRSPTSSPKTERKEFCQASSSQNLPAGTGTSDPTEVIISDDNEPLPLFAFIANGDIDSVRKAITDDRTNLRLRDNKGWTLLHAAAAANELEIARYLLESGAHACVLDDTGQFPVQFSQTVEMERMLEDAMMRSKRPTML